MRAVVCRAYGPPEDLVVEQLPSPECGPGRVRVRIEAAGVNFVDALLVQGLYQIKPPLPFQPGGEGAGSVVEVGEGVERFAVGDRVVFSSLAFAFAEEVVLAERQLSRAPASLSIGQAATFTQSYGTAWFALHERARLQPGARLLVLGAGGGVGLAAVDVGRALGLEVIAAASSADKLALASAHGAAATIDYTTESLKDRARELTGGRGVDAVYDPVGGPLAEAGLRALAEDGQLLVVGFASGTIPQLPANHVLLRNRRVTGVDWGGWIGAHPGESDRHLTAVGELIDRGEVHPTEPAVYPLEEAGRALRDLLDRRVVGKAVVVP